MICSSVNRLFFMLSPPLDLRENASFNWLNFPRATPVSGHRLISAGIQNACTDFKGAGRGTLSRSAREQLTIGNHL